MMKRTRWVLLILVCALLGFLQQTGWFSQTVSWQQSSGWDRGLQQTRPVNLGGPTLYWLGHSGFLLVWHGRHMVLDANLSKSCLPVKRLIKQAPPNWPGPVEVALVSHAHYDHFDLPTLESLTHLKTLVAPVGLDRYLSEGLAARVSFLGMEVGQHLQLGPLTVSAVAAKHGGGRSHPLSSRHPALGYVIEDGTTALYFAGDSAYGEHYREIAAAFHPRIAILPIGAYAPRFMLRYHHMSPEEAVQAALDLGVETVIPCHFGTFRLAFDRPQTALPRFARAARTQGLDWYLPKLLGAEALGETSHQGRN